MLDTRTEAPFLTGGGQMGAVVRTHDWVATPLGAPESWPASLKTMVSVVLNSALLGTVLWGPELRLIYNDAYAPVLAERHPAALGCPIAEVWGDVWEQLAPAFLGVMNTGQPVFEMGFPLRMVRDGIVAETFWNYSVAPIRDASGQIVGLLNQAIEITAQVIAEQKLQALNSGLRQEVTDRTDERDRARKGESDALVDGERVQLALAAGAIIGTWNWDIPGDRFTVDEAFAVNFGLDPALGRSGISLAKVVETVHPDDRAALAVAINEAMARGGRYAHQYRTRRQDGRYYWLEANGHVELAPDGTALRFPGVLIDMEDRQALIEERDRALTSLREGEAYWRGLFERLTEGFLIGELVKDGSGSVTDWRYLDVNAAWGELVSLDPTTVVGRTIREVFPGIEEDWIEDFAEVVRSGQSIGFTRRVGALNRWYEGRAFPLGADRFGVIFLEISDRILMEARRSALLELGDRLRELNDVPALVQSAAEIMAHVSEAVRAGYGVVDTASETVDVLTDWCAPGHVSLAGRHTFRTFGSYIENLKRGEVVAIDDVTTDPRTRDEVGAFLAIKVRGLLNIPILERGHLVGIAFVNHAQPHTYSAEELDLVRAVAERVQAAVARVRIEERQDVLNHELSHRLKNTLAMVLSIATQTLRNVPDQAPVDAFEKRVHALSSAHDILLRQEWSSAPLNDVARAVLGTFAQADRFIISGPSVALGARAALSTSLLLHELGTNAAKYGALSAEAAGLVTVSWRLEGVAGEEELVVDWTETGGPPVTAPTHRGFGSRLIRLGLVGTGGVAISYPMSGVRAEMRARLAQIGQS